jgi:hypothetical protein
MVSAVIVVQRTEEGHALPVQRPVYYISKVLSETKARYPHIQKLLYAVVLARRKLRQYFEAHPVTVVFGSSVLALWINQETQWFSGEPLETLRTRCSLRQSPLMTRLPRSPGSALVLRLNQETVHEFILLFMPPCGPHLTPLATGSLERSLLVFSTPGGLTGDDLSRLFFTCTNTSQAAACTCNT